MMTSVPYDDRDGWIWMDGDFVPWREAKIHVLTHSLHYGAAVFEGERCYNGRIFESDQHSRRLKRSAEIVGYEIPWSVEEINAAKEATVARMGLENCYIRAFAWRGSEMMGVSAPNNRIHMSVAAWHWGDYFADKMKGVKLTFARWRRPDPATAPHDAKASGLYMICTLSKHEAEAAGYADAVMLDWQGRVAECTGANIFFVQDNAIHTPIADCFLDGITRRTVIALARAKGYEVVERRILPEELGNFREVFITGSAAEVTPVSEIGPHSYQPGRVCEDLSTAYANLVRGVG
jgi:branched-chain amino acid aminotransferase